MAAPIIRLGTFYSEDMSRSAQLCCESAKKHGVNQTWRLTPAELRTLGIYEKNKEVFDTRRGRGLWAWKPLVILGLMDSFRGIKDGDFAVYADAGVEFIDNVRYIIDRMVQDVFLFGNSWEHAHWCKRDIVEAVWPVTTRDLRGLSQDGSFQSAWRRFGKQVQASVIFFRVNDTTRAFVQEWLDWCLFEGGRLIDDSPSQTPNHPEFQENRHDQAILTTMAYRDGYKLHWWPAIYNDGAFTYEKGVYTDDYPALFHHTRKRNSDF
jgi:hypothetical protein